MNMLVKIHGVKLCDLKAHMYPNIILDLLTEVHGTPEHVTHQWLIKLQCVYIPCDIKNETIIMRC